MTSVSKVAVLAREFPFAKRLGSQARQSAAERAWSSISHFYDNCKKKVRGKKGFPKFKKNCRSVEYKTSGWKLSDDRKYITFSDKNEIGTLKLKSGYQLDRYSKDLIKRVRIVRRADGYYAQFCVDIERREELEPTQSNLGLDVGLASFYTDSFGNKVDNPRRLRKSEKSLHRLQRRVSKKFKRGQPQSNNYCIAKQKLGKKHLKVSR